MVTVNTFDFFSPFKLILYFLNCYISDNKDLLAYFFYLLLKYKVGNNNAHTLIELICCFGLMKLKKYLFCYRNVHCCYRENTNFVNMIIVSTYLSGARFIKIL